MIHLLHTHWLWFFGALALGIIVGWVTYAIAATRWLDRPVHIAIAVVALAAIVAVAKVVPGRYGYWLDLGVILAVFYAIGCFIGWALRDLAEFVPAATTADATATAPARSATGSYLFREAHAGLATGCPYMRAGSTEGAPARQPLVFGESVLSKPPAPGGYTFPRTQPFAEATTSRAAAPAPGVRRHWSWPREPGAVPAATPEFTGSKGGYIFPAAVADAAPLAGTRSGTSRAGLYRHWSWRGVAPATPAAATDESGQPRASSALAPAAAPGRTAAPAFASAPGGYVFPIASGDTAPVAARKGTNKAGQYKHWSWRGASAAGAAAGVAEAGGSTTSTPPVPSSVAAAPVQDAPVAPAPGPAEPPVAAGPAATSPAVPPTEPPSVTRPVAENPVAGAPPAAASSVATPTASGGAPTDPSSERLVPPVAPATAATPMPAAPAAAASTTSAAAAPEGVSPATRSTPAVASVPDATAAALPASTATTQEPSVTGSLENADEGRGAAPAMSAEESTQGAAPPAAVASTSAADEMTPAPHSDAGGPATTEAAGPSPRPTAGAASHSPAPNDGVTSAVPAEAAPTTPAASPSPPPDASIPAPVG
ncbi:MAG: hypothetical protein OTI36_20900, partial [Beijerinckiaceae bacterium]|nr:hypothetical protein [Beijerinckiaceae bacterium]